MDLSLSVDGGNTWTTVASGISGGVYRDLVPHTPSKFAQYRVERAIPRSVAETGSFTIQSSIALLALAAVPSADGGAQLTWNTDPGPADLAGYRLERREASRADYHTLVSLTQQTAYRDASAKPGASYRLLAVNGLGEETLLGETPLAAASPLTVWPQPLRGGDLTVTFAVTNELGGPGEARVDVLDTSGRLLRTLTRGTYATGYHTTTWDARDAHRRAVANGVYVVRTTSRGQSASVKVLVAR